MVCNKLSPPAFQVVGMRRVRTGIKRVARVGTKTNTNSNLFTPGSPAFLRPAEFFGEGPAANPPEAYDSETQDDKSQTYESFPVTLWFINAARRLSWKGSTQTAHPHAVVPVSDGGEGI